MEQQIIKIIEKITNQKDIQSRDLIEEEILDSLAFIELITELEDTFDIEIQPTKVPSDTWRSVGNIVKMVEKEMEE